MSDVPPSQPDGEQPADGGSYPPPPPSGPPSDGGSYPPPGAAPAYGAAPGHGGPPPADNGLLSATWNMTDPMPANWAPKQKVTAGLLGILLGGFGAHSFYLGNTKKGVIQLVASIFTCGLLGLWGFIEGILILTGSQNTDAYGQPLTD